MHVCSTHPSMSMWLHLCSHNHTPIQICTCYDDVPSSSHGHLLDVHQSIRAHHHQSTFRWDRRMEHPPIDIFKDSDELWPSSPNHMITHALMMFHHDIMGDHMSSPTLRPYRVPTSHPLDGYVSTLVSTPNPTQM